jgi:peptidyl-prolyl cis-trans isomerase B (cyclophilin B)
VILTVLPRQEAVIKTDFGSIRLKLLYDKAPVHVRNFVELISDEFYDGLTFHRVVPGGLIQGGAPKEDIMGVRPDGKRLRAEFNDVEFVAGTVGMARLADDPHSASCQFFVCLSRQPWLDRKQTAFAQVIGKESFDTLDDIAAVATDDRDKPLEKVYIRSISLENVKEEVEANDDEKSDARKVPIQRLGPEQSGGKMHSSVALRSQPAVGSVSDAVTTRPAGGQ